MKSGLLTDMTVRILAECIHWLARDEYELDVLRCMSVEELKAILVRIPSGESPLKLSGVNEEIGDGFMGSKYEKQ